MRLLLTSNGICNKSIEKALRKWIKRDIRIAFIPTASHVAEGEKSWLIKNYVECQKIGQVYIADIAAIDKKIWLPRLEKANVIVMGGGSSSYLMKKIKSSGLDKELPRLLKDRVYVGISAGSIIVSEKLYSSSEFLFKNEISKPVKGLGFVKFNIRPHFNSKKVPDCKETFLKNAFKKTIGEMYALDDNSAIVVDRDEISVVSEGKWKLYGKK